MVKKKAKIVLQTFLLYSGKCLMDKNFARMPLKPSEEFFIFVKQTHSTSITSLLVDCLASHANLATRRNDEAKKQGGVRMAESSFCVKAFVFWNAAVGNKLACHKSTFHLDLNSFAAFYMALLVSYSKLILFYSGH